MNTREGPNIHIVRRDREGGYRNESDGGKYNGVKDGEGRTEGYRERRRKECYRNSSGPAALGA